MKQRTCQVLIPETQKTPVAVITSGAFGKEPVLSTLGEPNRPYLLNLEVGLQEGPQEERIQKFDLDKSIHTRSTMRWACVIQVMSPSTNGWRSCCKQESSFNRFTCHSSLWVFFSSFFKNNDSWQIVGDSVYYNNFEWWSNELHCMRNTVEASKMYPRLRREVSKTMDFDYDMDDPLVVNRVKRGIDVL